jgi:hypothetical protein
MKIKGDDKGIYSNSRIENTLREIFFIERKEKIKYLLVDQIDHHSVNQNFFDQFL